MKDARYSDSFAAGNCRKVSDLSLDETEFLGDVLLTEEEIDDLIRRGGFQQAIHVMAFMMLKAGY